MQSSAPITVLHVDDEPDFTEMAAQFVERQNQQLSVETATNATDGLDRIQAADIDCVVSDYDMPGQNGIEFLEAVREGHPDLPFILYTGKGSEEVASEAIFKGVTDYLQKESGTSQYEVLANRIKNATEQRRAQEIVEETEMRLQTIAENTNEILWKFTADLTELLFVNSPYEEIWGRTIEELRERPRSFLEGVHPEDRDLVETAMSRLSDGESVDIEYRVNAKEDFSRWVWVQGEPVYDDTGEVVKVVGFARDITERKEREQELRETKSRLETTTARQDRHLTAFEGFLDIATDPASSFDEQMRAVLALGVDYLNLDIGILSKIDPPDYVVQHVVASDGSIDPGTHFDLRETFCELVYEAEGPVAFHTPVEGNVEAHPAYRDLGLESYIGEPLSIEDDRYGTLNFSSPTPRQQPFSEGERSFVRTMAEWVSHEIRRQEREEEITRLNQLHQTVLANIRETVLVTNEGGEFTYVCPNVHMVFGNDAEEVTELGTVEGLFGEQLIDGDTLEATGEVRNMETRITDSSGNERDVVVTVRQVDIGDGTRLYSVRDISELKERERELHRQNERLGEFASVVSHDLQSPLTVAQGRLELVADECDSDHLDAVTSALDRMETLIDDMRSLARSGQTVGETESVDLSELVPESWQQVQTASGELIVETDATIQADRTRVQQLVDNLLQNAIAHGGADVTVTVGNLPNGFYVEDDGPGIPPDERETVLEPGYSLDEETTGFGLSIVRDIAEAHGWTIELTSGANGGTRIDIVDIEKG